MNTQVAKHFNNSKGNHHTKNKNLTKIATEFFKETFSFEQPERQMKNFIFISVTTL